MIEHEQSVRQTLAPGSREGLLPFHQSIASLVATGIVDNHNLRDRRYTRQLIQDIDDRAFFVKDRYDDRDTISRSQLE